MDKMNLPIRVEFPISDSSKIIRESKLKTIGDLRKKYSDLRFVKYIYLDPKDNKLKGDNPPDNLPVVSDSYITIAGEAKDIIEFITDASKV